MELKVNAYFNNKTSMSILEENYLSSGEHDVITSKITPLSLLSGECMSSAIFENFFTSICPIRVLTKVHSKILQLLVVTFDTRC